LIPVRLPRLNTVGSLLLPAIKLMFAGMETTSDSLADSSGSDAGSPPVVRRSKARSAVMNGSSLLPNVDGRSLWARLMRDTLRSLEVHCGGALSETQRLAARRVSTLEAELIFLEDKFAQARAEGREPDISTLDLYGRLADRQRRLADSALGWQRTPRDVGPTLGDLMRLDIEERRQEQEAAEAAAAKAAAPDEVLP
jgi:hypothetical protein